MYIKTSLSSCLFALQTLNNSSVLHSISISPPLHLTNHTPQLIQRAPHLNHRIPQHSRIQAQGSAHGVLCSGGAVKANNKIVACVVGDCVFSHGLGEVEDAPVCDAADYAAGVEDDVASCFCDSVDGGVRRVVQDGVEVGGNGLADFG